MMVMTIITFRDQLEPSHPIPEIESLYHPHPFQQMHGPVNGGEITLFTRQRGKDLLVGERVGPFAQNS